VSSTIDARLRRYALYSGFHGVVVVGALSGLLGSSPGLIILIASGPLVFAWGSFQADVAFNSQLDHTERNRWRILLWMVPWSMTFYWHRYVRPRHDLD
jgi:hypothetical protein